MMNDTLSTVKAARGRAESGGVGVSVLAAAATLLVMGAIIALVLKNYQRQQIENHRKAEQISLYGLQAALEKLGKEPLWEPNVEKTSYKEGWYAVSLRRFTRHDTLFLEITSEGRKGSVSDVKTCLLSGLSPRGDSGWVPRGMY